MNTPEQWGRRRARLLAMVAGAALAAVTFAPALAAEAELGDGAVPWTGLIVVGVLTLAIPVLFLVATQLRAPAEGEEADEELEPVVAGIGQGRAPVPPWLYAVYVVIPVWAMFYLFSGAPAELAPPTPEPTEAPAETPSPDRTPPPVSNTVRIVAKDLKFDLATITVKAGEEVTVEFRNEDPQTPHNFAVYTDRSLSEEIFKGEIFNGVATRTHTFPAPDPGTYFFQCDVHPVTMTGDFIVQA